MNITKVVFTPAPAHLHRTGLRGWSKVVLDGRLLIGGIAIRRTTKGKLVVTFPTRVDARGVEHGVVYPLDEDTRKLISEAVLMHATREGSLS